MNNETRVSMLRNAQSKNRYRIAYDIDHCTG